MKASNLSPFKYADASRSVRHVFIRDLELDSFIGIYDHEKAASQKIRINFDLSVNKNQPALKVIIDNVVCYEKIETSIKKMVKPGNVNLLEPWPKISLK